MIIQELYQYTTPHDSYYLVHEILSRADHKRQSQLEGQGRDAGVDEEYLKQPACR